MSIKRNIAWNFLGSALPLAIGLLLIPALINAIGIERFGLLAIAWVLVGYFSFFDMGLSRALTQIVSEKLSGKSPEEIPHIIRTASNLMWWLGILGGIVVWQITPWLVQDVLKISAELRQETIQAFRILAFSIPFVVSTSGLRGIMEAFQLFKQASLIRMALGFGTFAGPFIASLFDPSLVYIAYSLVIVRLGVWWWHRLIVRNRHELDWKKARFTKALIPQLFSFGAWMALSNIISPLMVYLDRFLIGALLTVGTVTYYVVPYEVITKLWIIPSALAGVLFPLFAKEWLYAPDTTAYMLRQGVIATLVLLFPLTFIASAFSPELLGLWLDQTFSENSAVVLSWIAAGVLVNSAAQIIYALVQGTGRADWTAKLHIAEAVPYWILLWFALTNYGIQGAAVAWFMRVAVDAVGLAFAATRINSNYRQALLRPVCLVLTSALVILVPLLIPSLEIRAGLVVIVLIFYFWKSWQYLQKNISSFLVELNKK